MNDAFGNTLVIEMRDLFTKDEILPKRGAAWIGPERILIIRKSDALIRGKRLVPGRREEAIWGSFSAALVAYAEM